MNTTSLRLRSTLTNYILKPIQGHSATVPTSQLHPPRSPASFTSVRHQHQQTQPAMEWLAIIPDHANALSKRLEVRPEHLSKLTPYVSTGKAVFGGAMLSAQPKEGETPGMTGSVMLFKGMSEEEVRERIRNDPYTKGGVWDAEAAKIMPFKCAIRTAM